MSNFVFGNLARELKKIKFNSIMQKIYEIELIEDWVISTVQNRLFEKGEDKDNIKLKTDLGGEEGSLGFYATSTEFLKGFQNIDRVTLKDSGEFYESFNLIATKSYMQLKANFQKENGHIFDNFKDSYSNKKSFEESILSLSNEEYKTFITKVFSPYFVSNFRFLFKVAIRNSK